MSADVSVNAFNVEQLQRDVDLSTFNTLGISAQCRYFLKVDTEDQLRDALRWAEQEFVSVLPLGGGSNIVLSDDYPGLVLQVGITGRSFKQMDDGRLLVTAGAGENWHDFVRWCLENRCYGLENLSLIPGSVGAAPIQNIGAYGVEIKDSFQSLCALDRHTGEMVTLDLAACAFGYRDSLFKGDALDRYVVTSVSFVLESSFSPSLGYGYLKAEVEAEAEKQGVEVDAAMVSDVICRIRSAKLPDPAVVGNAGSFFKNPVVGDGLYQSLQQEYSNLVAFPAGRAGGESRWKLAAGWLIDQCGFKGMATGSGAGVYEHQALVLVNRGQAKGQDILALASQIREEVKNRFRVDLEIEPRIY